MTRRLLAVPLLVLVTSWGSACSGSSRVRVDEPPAPAAAPAPAPAALFSPLPTVERLVLVHLSDTESSILADANAHGGVARTVSIVAALRQDERALVVHAGDTLIPAPELSLELDGTSAVALAHNLLAPSAAALGNHELDLGEGFLADHLKKAAYPTLTATVTVEGGPLQALVVDVSGKTPWAKDTAGKIAARAKVCLGKQDGDTCEGLVVGLIGATTNTLRTVSAGASNNLVTPTDAAALRAAIQRHVDALTFEGITAVVLLSHLQDVAVDVALVAGGLTGVDAIVSAGGENLLANPAHRLLPGDTPDPRFCGPAAQVDGTRDGAGCFPLVVRARDGRPTLITATAGQWRYVGRTGLLFDKDGVLTGVEATSAPWPVDEESLLALRAPLDKAALAFEQRAHDALAPLLGVLSTTERFLEGTREAVRNRQTNLGDLSADALQRAARTAVPAPVAGGATRRKKATAVPPLFALRNGGGIRGSIGSLDDSGQKTGGPVRLIDLQTALRFDSKLVAVTTTHAGLVRTLESALRGVGTARGHFPQVSKEVELHYSVEAPEQTHTTKDGKVVGVGCPGARVRRLVVTAAGAAPVVIVDDGVVNAPDAAITFATIDYLAKGGDGWFPGAPPVIVPLVDPAGAPVGEQGALRSLLTDADAFQSGKPWPDPVPGDDTTFTRIRAVSLGAVVEGAPPRAWPAGCSAAP